MQKAGAAAIQTMTEATGEPERIPWIPATTTPFKWRTITPCVPSGS